MNTIKTAISGHKVVSREEWLEARKELLKKEKESSDFNPDFHVSFTKDEMGQGKVNYNYTMQEFPSEEAPGVSVFYKDPGGALFHTYSTYGRGVEQLVGTYMILDMVPKGRDEDHLGFTMEWVRHHDRYGTDEFADAKALLAGDHIAVVHDLIMRIDPNCVKSAAI